MKSPKGFTLLEVIVALAILAIALMGFHQAQTSVVKITLRSEAMAQAAELAQMQMTETELELKKKNFQAFLEEEKGEFKDEGLKRFKWVRKIEKVDLGCFMPTPNPNDKTQSQQQGFLEIAEKIFTEAIRKITIRVEWVEGDKTHSVQVSQLYVNYNALPDIKF